MKQYTLAKTAGFCFGVNRAVDLVYDLIAKQKKAATLGPIIHNPQMVEELSKKGVRIISSPLEAQPDECVVIRSHGVCQSVYDELITHQISYVDATCPFVAKIHRIVERESKAGAVILIAGDPDHPEVQGIKGHASGPVFVARDAKELKDLSDTLEFSQNTPFVLVAQTTYHTSF